MNRIIRLAILVLVLSVLAAAPLAAQSANGSFSFSFDDTSRTIEFNARSFGSSARGEMTFNGVVTLPDQDVDGDGDNGAPGTQPYTIRVEFDCLKVSGNRAAMSGVVTQSSIAALIGRRGLLTVEDGGEGVNSTRDSFTWGLYRPDPNGWTPSDFELEFDNGASLTWHATDFERLDDIGIPSTKLPTGDCRSFGLASYDLTNLVHGAGNIQVRQ